MPVKGFERLEDQSIEAIERLYGEWYEKYKKFVIKRDKNIPYICDYTNIEFPIKWDTIARRCNLLSPKIAPAEKRLSVEYLMEHYKKNKGFGNSELKKFKTTFHKIKEIGAKSGIVFNENLIFDKKLKNEIVNDYKNKISQAKISKKYKISNERISKILKEFEVKKRSISEVNQKFYPNQGRFEYINSERDAYFFGLMLADGNIKKNQMAISLQAGDKYILESYKNFIYPHKQPELRYIEKRKSYLLGEYVNCQPQWCFQFSNIEIANNLKRCGCLENKSKTAFINYDVVDHNYIRHIIRGIFDGDGSIFKTKTPSKYDRYSVSFCGASRKLSSQIIEFLDSFGITSCLAIIPADGKDRKSDFYVITVNNKEDVFNFCKLIYGNSTIFLKRKFNKFKEFLNYREYIIIDKTLKQQDGKFRGVKKNYSKFVAENSKKYIGTFLNKEDAATAYNNFLKIKECKRRLMPESYNWINYEELRQKIDPQKIIEDLNVNYSSNTRKSNPSSSFSISSLLQNVVPSHMS